MSLKSLNCLLKLGKKTLKTVSENFSDRNWEQIKTNSTPM